MRTDSCIFSSGPTYLLGYLVDRLLVPDGRALNISLKIETLGAEMISCGREFHSLTVVACTSGNLVIQVQHGFSFKKIG